MSAPLSTSRLEAFSDGVIAVIITIMVLEIHVPAHEVNNWESLRHIAPLLLVYALSFLQTGIYWVNHHYLLDDLEQVTHGILWSNLTLLFCLSLTPAATAWVGERGISSFSVALYAVTLALPGLPWMWLSALICTNSGSRPPASFQQGALSLLLYASAFVMALYSHPYIALCLIGTVATIWLVPPRRIVERTRKPRQSQSALNS